MTKTGFSYFLIGDPKNAHCAICAFDKYAGFSQIRSHMADKNVQALLIPKHWDKFDAELESSLHKDVGSNFS